MTFEETRELLIGQDKLATISCPIVVGIGLRGRFEKFIEALKHDPRFRDLDISLINYGGFISRNYKIVADGHTDELVELLDEVESFYLLWNS